MNRRPTKPPQPTAAQLGIRAGDRVTRLGDGGEVTEHTATSDPWQSYEGGPWLIKLSGIAGGWILTRIDKVATPPPAPGSSAKRHTFHMHFKDGTEASLTVDLSGNSVTVTSSFDASKRPDLEAEFRAWADSIATQIVPLLNGDQMRAAAVVGMQLISERQKRE